MSFSAHLLAPTAGGPSETPHACHGSDPLQADDWLRAVERQLDIAQCDDRERVLYAAGQL